MTAVLVGSAIGFVVALIGALVEDNPYEDEQYR